MKGFTLQSIYNLFGQDSNGYWIMHPQNAKRLYNLIKQNPKIKTILDLGTGIGCSASIAALALMDSERKGHVHTMEQFAHVKERAEQVVPEELKAYITFHQSDVVPMAHPEIPYQFFSTYKKLPAKKWDLIIVDGPGPFEEDGKYVDLANGDVLKLLAEGKMAPGVQVAFDGRRNALATLERYYADCFYLALPGGNTDFNVLERKDVEPVLRDVKHENMKNIGYFDLEAPKPQNPELK